jgi:hypothetical protein
MFGFASLCVALYLLSDLAARISLSSARNRVMDETTLDMTQNTIARLANIFNSPVVDQANHVFKQLDTCQAATFGTS